MGILPMFLAQQTFNICTCARRNSHGRDARATFLFNLNPLHIEAEQSPVFADSQGPWRGSVG
jgi:hypothetical protein